MTERDVYIQIFDGNNWRTVSTMSDRNTTSVIRNEMYNVGGCYPNTRIRVVNEENNVLDWIY